MKSIASSRFATVYASVALLVIAVLSARCGRSSPNPPAPATGRRALATAAKVASRTPGARRRGRGVNLTPAETVQSSWTAVDLAADRVAWARLLRRAHEVALSGRGTPPVLRPVIVRSWERCVAARVDPDCRAPRVLDDAETAIRLAAHPLAEVVPILRGSLGAATTEARHLIVLSDADGVLLWAEGHPSMLEAAIAPRFLPGALCSEAAVGTNAPGTALALDHPIQVFSAEHFSRRLDGWSSAAAPIHQPATGPLLGAVGLSWSFRHAHPHSLALVTAVARAAEAHLGRERERRDAGLADRYVDRLASAGRYPSALVTGDGRVLAASPRGWLDERVDLPAPEGHVTLPGGDRAVVEPIGDGASIVWRMPAACRRVPRRVVRIRALGGAPPSVVVDGRRLALSPRHAELLVILALRPGGLSADALARALHGPGAKAVTVRAELARLRRSVGDVVAAQPYRLAADVRADFFAVEHALRRGALDGAVALYAGPLLPSSRARAIVAARAHLQAALDGALCRRGEPRLRAAARRDAGRRRVRERRRPRTAPWPARSSRGRRPARRA